MKLFAVGLTAIALLPLPAIARPYSEPINAPACYMITSSGRLINLNSLCSPNAQKAESTGFEITADDICLEFGRRFNDAKTQFQKDEAQKGLDTCKNNRASVESVARFRLK